MENKKRKILYISGTRADYGLMKNALLAIKSRDDLDLEIAATGEALMKEHGRVFEQIKKDGFKVCEIKAVIPDSLEARPIFLGKFLEKLAKKIKKINPQIILVLGDRAEMLAGAIQGVYLGIPVAHIHGGEVTLTPDEPVRHAITKLATLHFPATQKSADRIIKMGEAEGRVFWVGAPGLKSGELSQERKNFLAKKYSFDLAQPLVLLSQHPFPGDAVSQMKETMEAIIKLGYFTIITVPNSDPGGQKMMEVIKSYDREFLKIYSNIEREEYFDLMKIAKVLVGNSSSGIIEAPFVALPAVNIGGRQNHRERASNVIDAPYDRVEIEKAIRKALSPSFSQKIKEGDNPYYCQNTEEKIAGILSRFEIQEGFQKQITY
jgi:GDP/UDP-N,N'-diacetylbacillosamine 2-epimerase (hydrolysing)